MTMTGVRWLLVLAAVAGMQFAPSDGRACEPCPQCMRTSSVWEDVVPANHVVRVQYSIMREPVDVAAMVQLQDAKGKPVPGKWLAQESNWFAFEPDAPLRPNTRYALADRFGTAYNQMDCTAKKDFRVWRRFKTRAPETATPPDAKLMWPAHVTCERQTCPDSGCCGPYDGWAVMVKHGLPNAWWRVTGTASAPGWGPHTFGASDGFRLFQTHTCTPDEPIRSAPEDFEVTLEAFHATGARSAAPQKLRIHREKEKCTVDLVPARP